MYDKSKHLAYLLARRILFMKQHYTSSYFLLNIFRLGKSKFYKPKSDSGNFELSLYHFKMFWLWISFLISSYLNIMWNGGLNLNWDKWLII